MELDDCGGLLDFDSGPDVDEAGVIEAANDVGRVASWSYDANPVRAVKAPAMILPFHHHRPISTWVQAPEKGLTWIPIPCDAGDEAGIERNGMIGCAVPASNLLGATDMAEDVGASRPPVEILPMEDAEGFQIFYELQTRSSSHHTSPLPTSSRSSSTSYPIELDLLPGVKRFAPLEVKLEPAEPSSTIASQPINSPCLGQRTSSFTINIQPSLPRSPTEAEMDAFFGYKLPAAPSAEDRSRQQPCFEPALMKNPDLNRHPPDECHDTAPRKFPLLENFDPGGSLGRSKGIGSVIDSEDGKRTGVIQSHNTSGLRNPQRPLVLPVELQSVPPAKQLSKLAQFQLKPIGPSLQGDARR
ncbi:BQ2448_4689 [Microbotryum intermedium]|uniref:BQ2448_4689 protein n=1 Tax=Microbotryum intermedium TaxID=269621 RepID=A0A238FFL7_9BASI|nr:BQ2448_4689 [Microbotryum intermedium]